MDVSVGTATVRVVEPDTLPSVAVILLVPLVTGVANAVAEIVATVVVCEAQVTWLVKSFVELSLYVPVAVNCCVTVRLVNVGVAGVTAIEVSVGTATVSVVEPDTLPRVAVILLVPLAAGVANPVAEIVATVVVCEAQVTWLVKSFVELSL